MFDFLRRLFGSKNEAADTLAPQDRQSAEALAAAGLQMPAEPPPVRSPPYHPDRGAYDRPNRRPDPPPPPVNAPQTPPITAPNPPTAPS